LIPRTKVDKITILNENVDLNKISQTS